MSTTISPPLVRSDIRVASRRRQPTSRLVALRTLAARRFLLSAHTPREILVPLLAPILFAVVIAPALASIGPTIPGVDYMSFAAIGIVGLLIPLNCMFSGIGVIVDRQTGARRDLLAAPVPRTFVVLANVVVAVAVTALQVAVMIVAVVARGAALTASATGVVWFILTAALLAIAMYGVAETLANRIPAVEEYTGVIPPLAIVPFFFAGSLFPITALPAWLTEVARFLPLTHAIALMRYGLLDNAGGLRDIWGMSNPTVMAVLSMLVVAAFATVMGIVAVRAFTRAAVT